MGVFDDAMAKYDSEAGDREAEAARVAEARRQDEARRRAKNAEIKDLFVEAAAFIHRAQVAPLPIFRFSGNANIEGPRLLGTGWVTRHFGITTDGRSFTASKVVQIADASRARWLVEKAHPDTRQAVIDLHLGHGQRYIEGISVEDFSGLHLPFNDRFGVSCVQVKGGGYDEEAIYAPVVQVLPKDVAQFVANAGRMAPGPAFTA